MRINEQYTIPGAPITKKNSQRMVRNKAGRWFPVPSKQYSEYEKRAGNYLQAREDPISEPVEIECHFFMPTRRLCDLTNLLEAVDDILVKYQVIADDNYSIIESHDGSRVHYDKENPRTEITIRGYEDGKRI